MPVPHVAVRCCSPGERCRRLSAASAWLPLADLPSLPSEYGAVAPVVRFAPGDRVVVRFAPVDPLRHDAQLDPPYRQLRQATQAHTGKRWSVVGPNGRWKSILPKGALKHPSRFVVVRLPQPIADQQVSRGGVLHRQRVDPGPISRSEPPLEVDRPHVIGPFCRRKRLAPRRCMPSTFSTLHQPCSVKDLSRRTRRRPRRVGLGISEATPPLS